MRALDDMVSSCVLFLFGLAIALYAPAFDLGTLDTPGPGFMPLLAALVICVSAVAGFIEALRTGRNDGDSLWQFKRLGQHGLVLALIFAYGALLNRAGFIVCSFLLIFASMHFTFRERWRSSALWAALMAMGSYVLFVVGLRVDLPRGIFLF